jgi:hypothetical protein
MRNYIAMFTFLRCYLWIYVDSLKTEIVDAKQRTIPNKKLLYKIISTQLSE